MYPLCTLSPSLFFVPPLYPIRVPPVCPRGTEGYTRGTSKGENINSQRINVPPGLSGIQSPEEWWITIS